MFEIEFLPQARSDIQSALEWYDERSMMAGDGFMKALQHGIESSKSEMVQYAMYYKNVFIIQVKKYPYSIFFKKDAVNKKIFIVAVLHDKQDRSALEKSI